MGLPPKLPEPAEIGRCDGCGGFHVDPRQVVRAALQHNVHLNSVLVTEVEEPKMAIRCSLGLRVEHEELAEIPLTPARPVRY